MLTPFVIASALLSAAQASNAPPPTPQPPVTVTRQLPPEEKPVCKSVDTGTLIPKRVCMSASEWKNMESNSREEMDRLRDQQRFRCGNATMC